MAELDAGRPAHEPNTASIAGVLWFAAILAVSVLATMLISTALRPWMMPKGDRRAEPASLLTFTQPPPEPRLQVSPPADLRAMREREDRLLGTYGWVDKEGGLVRIPIERAMELTVSEGVPVAETPR